MLSLLLSGALTWVMAGTSAADLATTEWALTKPVQGAAAPEAPQGREGLCHRGQCVVGWCGGEQRDQGAEAGTLNRTKETSR